ncbi:hypothetical protein ACTU9R_35440 [Burkholderia gladioli]|uniref:hypothetical protein n=1 Tax=Burkholderia gladioli TaxID=28095 RepID=UPI003FA58651
MITVTKRAEEFTSIADWERQYLPNGAALDSADFDAEQTNESVVDALARELCRPTNKHSGESRSPRKARK